eukprot:TRINITY_DN65201_c0_g1_i1.p1 TRINITY_DN65201_c0_g1~~TRINITY_DN65201_c0_g1_i1.p1  ORF type:complete len:139 (+),score=29.95 TRINITY_DN65201_c0_g1_i1:37-417(+)
MCIRDRFRKGLDLATLPPWSDFWEPSLGSDGQVPDESSISSWLSPEKSGLPFVVELSLFAAGRFVSDDHIKLQLEGLAVTYGGAGRQFVLKANGKLATDMKTVNQKVVDLLRSHLQPNLCVSFILR